MEFSTDCEFTLPASVAKGKPASQSWPDDEALAGLVVDSNWDTGYLNNGSCSNILQHVRT